MSDLDPDRTTVPAVHNDHHAPTVARNAKVGLGLFAVYLLLYAGFMALVAFAPGRMSIPVFVGVNLAVTYGLVLIVGAFVLALLYMYLVRGRADDAIEPSTDHSNEGR